MLITPDTFNDEYWAAHHPNPGHENALASYVAQKARRVLDIGCGRGSFVQQLRGAGVRAEGIDYSPTAIELSLAPDHCRLGDVCDPNMRASTRSFDAVTAWHVLDCIPHGLIQTALRNMRRSGKRLFACVRTSPEHDCYARSHAYWTRQLEMAGWRRVTEEEEELQRTRGWGLIVADRAEPLADSEPLVSIVIPVYRAERWIGHCLDAVAAQTYPNVEVIVVEDGKEDLTESVVAERGGDAVRFIAIDHAGAPAARNVGIRESAGDIIVPFDADDMMPPNYVDALVSALEANPDASYAYAGWVASGHAEQCLPQWPALQEEFLRVRDRYDQVRVPFTTFVHYDPDSDVLWRKCSEYSYDEAWRFLVSGTWLAARRQAIEAVEGYDEGLPMYQDRDLNLRLHTQGSGTRADATWMLTLAWPNHASVSGSHRMARRRPILEHVLANHGIELPRVAFVAFGSTGQYEAALPTLRYRAGDMDRYHPNATIVKDLGELRSTWPEMDVFVFVRPVVPELLGWAEKLRRESKTVILDWTTGKGIIEDDREEDLMLERWCQLAHACTCATDTIAAGLRGLGAANVAVVPDCISVLAHRQRKNDYSWQGRFCWHGYAGNAASLFAIAPLLDRLCREYDAKVRVICETTNTNFPFPVEHVPWELATVQDAIRASDIVLDPTLTGGCFLYKSDNKTVMSWALGVPVVRLSADSPNWEKRLRALIESQDARAEAAWCGWQYVVQNRTEKHFVKAMMEVVSHVYPAD